MAIPDFSTLMLPVLKQFADGTERRSDDIRAPLAVEFSLTPEEQAALVPNGPQSFFGNRIAWALGNLRQAGLLRWVRRGVYQATATGKEVLATPPEKITTQFLERFPEFLAFKAPKLNQGTPQAPAAESALGSVLTPDEQIRAGHRLLRANLAAQLLDRVRQVTPRFFEQLVVKLLVAMGYGGSYEDAVQVVGKSGDGGIDGIIKEDRLGLESIYVQAKRWEGTVGRPVIQQFAGALHGKNARKGVLITTSSFSREAVEYAEHSAIAIILIDGEQLAELMIEFGVGVSEVETIKLKRLDEDYFGEG